MIVYVIEENRSPYHIAPDENKAKEWIKERGGIVGDGSYWMVYPMSLDGTLLEDQMFFEGRRAAEMYDRYGNKLKMKPLEL